MDKKGDILNQLAIISDLIEKVNFESKNSVLLIDLEEKEFVRVFDYIRKKYGKQNNIPDEKFSITIDSLDIIFNKSSV